MTGVLITNLQLTSRSGTEIVVRDLAGALLARGHDVCVYAPRLGRPAAELVGAGCLVVDDLDAVPFAPDVIHGHHHTPTIDALTAFPRTPALWVCHDRLQYEDIPPRHPAIRRYVAVDLNCRERLVEEAGLPTELVSVIPNAVDLERFARRPDRTGPPTTAAVFSNQARPGGYLDAIRTACRRRGIELDVHGTAAGNELDAPELVLGRYDLVFAKARCALEALAVGCAVVLVDQPGLGPLVTADTVEDLRQWNFGARLLQYTPTPDRLLERIDRVDMGDAARVCDHVRTVGGLATAVDRYERLYAETIAAGPPEAEGFDALASALGHTSLLERRLRVTGTSFRTVRLPPAVVPHIRITVERPPEPVAPGSRFGLDARIHNGSREALVSEQPWPVHLAYHWRHPTDQGLDVFEGDRTPLPHPVAAGTDADVRIGVTAPPRPGVWRLHLTMLQESVMWFDEVDPGIVAELAVRVGDDGSPVTLADLLALAAPIPSPVRLARDAAVSAPCFLDDAVVGGWCFAESDAAIDQAVGLGSIAAVIVSSDGRSEVPPQLGLLVADDPRRTFYELHNALAGAGFFRARRVTSVDPTARVDATAVVDRYDVEIGPDCVVGPRAVIEGPASIGPRTRIDAGAVIGTGSFQHSGVAHGDLELVHTGSVVIAADCHVHANAVIARGQLTLPTTIGRGTRIGNGAFVSHRCEIGEHVTIGHNATVNGRVGIGAGAWIGPGACVANGVTIGEAAHVALGSVVIQPVPAGGKVAGMPALGRYEMFRHVASIRGRSR